MDRRHLILPAALLAGSALLAGRAAIGSLPLGPDAPAASVGTLVDATDGSDIAERAARLDATERRIAALDAQVPPALPAAPAPVRAPTQVRVVGAPAPAARPTDSHGGRGRDHAEDDEHRDDHGRGDNHGGDRDRGEDDHSGHGGRGGGDDD